MDHTGSPSDHRLLPAWPPLTVPEALLAGVTVVVVRLLLGLWLPGGLVPFYSDPWLAALAQLAEGLRWLMIGLALALAARVVLRVSVRLALGIGFAVLAASWAGPPLRQALLLPAPFEPWRIVVVLAAVIAAGLAVLQRTAPLRVALFTLVTAALLLFLARYQAIHGWLLGHLGLAVRGALVPDLAGPQRDVLNLMPLVVAVGGLWLAWGGDEARVAWRILRREWPLPQLGFAALAAAWGYVLGARTVSDLTAMLQPPAVYGLACVLLALGACAIGAAAVRARQRRHSELLLPSAVVIVLAVAALLGGVGGSGTLAAVALFAVTLLVLAWPLGATRPPLLLELGGGGLLALLAYGAGSLAVPGLTPADLLTRPLGAVGFVGAGAAIAGLARLIDETVGRRPGTPARPRLLAALWLADYLAALAMTAAAVARQQPLLWVGLALALAGLLGLVAIDRGLRLGERLIAHAALYSAILLVAATAVLMVPQS